MEEIKNIETIDEKFKKFLLDKAGEIYEEKKAAYGDKLIGVSVYLSSQGGMSTEAWDYTKGADGAECIFREYYTKEFLETHNLLELVEDAKSELSSAVNKLRQYLNSEAEISTDRINEMNDRIQYCKDNLRDWQESLDYAKKRLENS